MNISLQNIEEQDQHHFNDLITQKLNNELLSAQQIPFKIDYTKNGLIINKFKNHIKSKQRQKQEQSQRQYFIYINSTYVKKSFNIDAYISYELVIIKLNNYYQKNQENEDQKQLKQFDEVVQRIPIQFFNDFNFSTLNYQSIQSVKIQLTINPHNQNFFLIYISQEMSTQRKDKVFISMFNLHDLIQKNRNKNQRNVLFYNINLKHQLIIKADWHPFSPTGLCILYEEQELQVFNFIDEPQQSQLSLNFKYLTLKSKSTSTLISNINKKKKIFINDFTFSQNAQSLQDYFTIYLSSKQGDIFAVYPFVVDKTVISQKHYLDVQNIKKCKEKDLNSNKNKNLEKLSNVLKQLKIIRNQQQAYNENNNGVQFSYPENFNSINKTIIQFKQIDQYSQFSQYSSQNQRQNQILQTISIQNINDTKLLIKGGYNTRQKCHYIKFSLIPQILHQNQNINYYPISVFYTKSAKQIKINPQSNKLNKIMFLNRLKHTSSSNYQQSLMIFDGQRCQKLEIKNMIKGIKQNDMSILQSISLVQSTNIFRLGYKQTLKDKIYAFTYKNQNIIMITKNNKFKFHYLKLNSLKLTQQLKQMNNDFNQYFDKYKQPIKIKKQQLDKAYKSGQQQQQKQKLYNQLCQLFKQTIYNLLQKNIKQFIDKVQQKMISQMSLIQVQYRQLKRLIQVFNFRIIQKKRMESLLQQARLNNQKISKLLINRKAKVKNNNGFSQNKRTNGYQQIFKNLQQIQRLLYSVTQDNKINATSNVNCNQQNLKAADNILNTLSNIKQQLLSHRKQ